MQEIELPKLAALWGLRKQRRRRKNDGAGAKTNYEFQYGAFLLPDMPWQAFGTTTTSIYSLALASSRR